MMDKLYDLIKVVFNGNLYTYTDSESQHINLPDNMNDFTEYDKLMLLRYAKYQDKFVFPFVFARDINLLFSNKYDYAHLIEENTQTAYKYYLIFLAIMFFTELQNSINNATIINNDINNANANINNSIVSARKIPNSGFDFAKYHHHYSPGTIKDYNDKTIAAIDAIEKNIEDYRKQNN